MKLSKRTKVIENELAIRHWNKNCPVGTKVIVTKDNGDTFVTVTDSDAQLLEGQTPVVWLVGVRGCYLLSRVRRADGGAS